MGIAGKARGFALAVTRVVVMLVAVTACGGRSVGDPAGAAGANDDAGGGGSTSAHASEAGAAGAEQSLLEQLPGRYLDAICTYYAECQGLRFRDLDHCRAELDAYGVDALLAALAAGHIALDQALLEKCLDDFAKDPCNPPRVSVTLQNDQLDIYQFLLACPGVLHGLMHEGDPCMASAECGARLRCEPTGCPGVCKPLYQLAEPCATEHEQCGVPYGICLQGSCRVPLEAGEPCADDFDCVRDLLCDAQQHMCIEPAQHPGIGGACIRAFNDGKPAIICEAGLYCDDNDDLGTLGLCRPLSAEGEPCDYQGCEPGLICIALAGGPRVCHVQKAAEGELCPSYMRSCQGDLICMPTGEPSTGVCRVGPTLAQACTTPCADGFKCQNGVCIHSAYLGDACGTADTFCESSRCVDGICQPHRHVGAACQTSDDCLTLACQSGVCLDRTACTP